MGSARILESQLRSRPQSGKQKPVTVHGNGAGHGGQWRSVGSKFSFCLCPGISQVAGDLSSVWWSGRLSDLVRQKKRKELISNIFQSLLVLTQAKGSSCAKTDGVYTLRACAQKGPQNPSG